MEPRKFLFFSKKYSNGLIIKSENDLAIYYIGYHFNKRPYKKAAKSRISWMRFRNKLRKLNSGTLIRTRFGNILIC